jgi:uncharacterized protein YutE (UPF0331/DUF86 family)
MTGTHAHVVLVENLADIVRMYIAKRKAECGSTNFNIATAMDDNVVTKA